MNQRLNPSCVDSRGFNAGLRMNSRESESDENLTTVVAKCAFAFRLPPIHEVQNSVPIKHGAFLHVSDHDMVFIPCPRFKRLGYTVVKGRVFRNHPLR